MALIQIVLIFIGVLVLGIIMLVRGLRGRAVDDHPVCRRCGFDLFGRPEGVNICSECGGDLRLPGAIQQGHHVRRKRLVAVGSGLIGLVLLTCVGAGWMAYSTTNFQTYLPVWCLIIETRSSDGVTCADALKELNARLSAGSLSQSQIDGVSDAALSAQADRSKTWLPEWGDFIESADAAGKLSADRWTKYILEAAELKLEVRPEVRIGDPIYFWIREAKARVGNRSNLVVSYSKQVWQIGPVHVDRGGGSSSQLSVRGSGATGSSIEFQKKDLDQLQPGPAKVRVQMEVKVARTWSGPAMATKKLDLTDTLKFLPADQPTVTFNHDPSFRMGVEKAMTVSQAEVQKGSPKYLNLTVQIGQLPVGIGYEVFTTIHGEEVKIGRFACPPGPHNGGWGFGGEAPEFEDESIDLVFKPSVDAAINTTTTFEIWDGQIEMKNIKVTHAPKPVTSPTSTSPVKAKPATTRPSSAAPAK